MTRLILIATLLLSSLANAGPHSIVFTKRNAADTGNELKTPQQPAANALVYMNAATNLPDYMTLGSGLQINAGVLSATTTPGATGAQGPAGTPGTNGTNGTDGRSAYQIAVANGYFGNESQWLLSLKGADGAPGAAGHAGSTGAAGMDGKSAYQLAQVNGYTGTLQQWLASLVGATGAKGDKGDTGSTGATGATGAQGIQGIQGIPGTPAPTFNFGMPTARALAVSTSYQATNTAKTAVITISPSCSASLTLAGGSTCSLQLRVGTSPVTCSTGTVVATWTNGNTGALTVGLALNQVVGSPYALNLPTGAAFVLCPVSGTFTISAAEQSAG